MVSTLSGPIPPHPYYDKSENQFSAPHRTRPEGEEYMVKGRGTVGALLAIEGQSMLVPSNNMRKHKPEPKDHVKENVRRMRQIQKDTRRAQEESSKPVKALWKTNRYEGVQSRVQQELQRQENPPARAQSAGYLRAHSRTGWVAPSRPQSAACAGQKEHRSDMPRAESSLQLKRNDYDFVKMNGMAARYSNMRRSPSLTALDDLKKKQEDAERSHPRGNVPKYLQNRQKQWQHEEAQRKAAEPDPEMPAGHRMMDNAERKETLKKLEETHHEIQCKMASLPVRTDTLHLRKQKEGLEKQMAEVEEAIKIFSRPKVFVRLDT